MTTVIDPDPTLAPYSFDGGPKLPAYRLSNRDTERTGHLFKGCEYPIAKPDNKRTKAEPCPECAALQEKVQAEVRVWRAIQEEKAKTWRFDHYTDDPEATTPVAVVIPTTEVVAAGMTPKPEATRNGATVKQVAFLVDLYRDIMTGATDEQVEAARTRAEAMTFEQAKAKISELIPKRDAARAERKANAIVPEKAQPKGEVPDGYYALPIFGESFNDLAFYRVTSSPKWGKSVQMVIGGHTDTYVPRRNVPGILARIAEATYTRPDEQHFTDEDGNAHVIPGGETYTGPDAAAMCYADHNVRCMRCNTKLTNLTSRTEGIGPVCATKSGF